MRFVIVESAECDHYRFHVATRNGAIPEREILQSVEIKKSFLSHHATVLKFNFNAVKC